MQGKNHGGQPPHNQTPRLSLLVPAHSAQLHLPVLIARLLEQSSELTPIEIVVSSDDGFDYRAILPDDPRIVFAEPGLSTGPAKARNRALARATGTHVCMMDADDSVSGLFLATIFRALERHQAFAVRSVYVRDRAVVRAFLERTLTLNSYVEFFGSVLVVAPRNGFPEFQDVLVEDGVATLAIMHWNGGSLPVINAEYRINLHPDSYCAANGHSFTSRYAKHLQTVDAIAAAVGDISLAPLYSLLYETRMAMRKGTTLTCGVAECWTTTTSCKDSLRGAPRLGNSELAQRR
ncbi:glycosyltransferase (plasmid) [Pseudomonas aeruginosa]|nr:glycosyltransferase [Pseudomonas aeruginosa]UTN36148.1 glycosyltransferase [Pseudomonas aeruginosa]